jgi:hypothetical protein
MPRKPTDTEPQDDALISVAEASKRLGIGRTKMTQLIAEGTLPIVGKDPLDKRIKLVRVADVEALLKRSTKQRRGLD